MERKCIYRNRLGMSSVIIVSATYSKSLTKEWVYSALNGLLKEEPLLCSNVFNSDSKEPVHRLLGEIDLSEIVLFEPEIKTIQELNDRLVPQVKLPYEDSSLPSWRVYIIGEDSKELVWVYDHSIADGSSGVLFHEKLLKFLNGSELYESNKIIAVKQVEMPLAIEDEVDMRPSWGYLLQNKFAQLKKALFGEERTWTGKPPAIPMASRTLFFELDPETSTKLVTYCRERRFTVTAVVYAALMKSIAKLWVSDPSVDHLVFTCPVNARRYIRGNDLEKSIGNFVYQWDLDFPMHCKDESVDSIASAFSDSLRAAMSEDPPSEMRYNKGMLDAIDVKQYLQDSYNYGRRPETAEISNLGAFEFDKTGKVTIDKLNFTQGVSTLGAYVTLNVVGVKHGTINGSFSVARDDAEFTNCIIIRDETIGLLKLLIN
ncbi:hypothetical protein TRVA0_039S01398 [Trichomonascus vanleenenianus]|uniref:alcohol O-acetyltransferase n=1 Tax=Trichomonascus vanleenenianus TaxID=2268995 RepID=UPI003ECB495C